MPPGALLAPATACRRAPLLATGLLVCATPPAAAWSWRGRAGSALLGLPAPGGATGDPASPPLAYGYTLYYADELAEVTEDHGSPGEAPSPGVPDGALAQEPPSGGGPPPSGPQGPPASPPPSPPERPQEPPAGREPGGVPDGPAPTQRMPHGSGAGGSVS